MTDIAAVREAMAEALRTIDGLNASPYLMERVNTPHAMIDWSTTYSPTFDGPIPSTLNFIVQVFGQRSDSEQTQRLFDVLRDPANPQSVPNVLEADDGIAQVVDFIDVSTVGPTQVVSVGSVDFLLIVFEVTVGA